MILKELIHMKSVGTSFRFKKRVIVKSLNQHDVTARDIIAFGLVRLITDTRNLKYKSSNNLF